MRKRRSQPLLQGNDDTDLYLGFDFSTQSLTTVIIQASTTSPRIVYQDQISYDRDLPRFGTVHGVIRNPGEPNEVVAPSLMFVAALDLALSRVPQSLLKRVRAISGSGQQHGTMYWSKEISLDPGKSLEANIADCFAVNNAPIWMDSSTSELCCQVEAMIPGGANHVAEITGSRAYERFSGNQVTKILKRLNDDETKKETLNRVTLISSGMASILAGRFCSIDWSDGSGMNLMDINRESNGSWSEDMLQVYSTLSDTAVTEWRRLLGDDPCKSWSSFGQIDPYFSSRFGLNPAAEVIAFSGDNPCTVAGLGLEDDGDVAVSLGTSTTLFAITESPRPSGEEGHVMRSPIGHSYMVMICFKNGAIPREDVCKKLAGGDWNEFSRLLRLGRQESDDRRMVITFALLDAEITPSLPRGQGIISFTNGKKYPFDKLSPSDAILSLIEGQCLALRNHAKTLGVGDRPRRLIVTGGASANLDILQVLSDVFQSPVFVVQEQDDDEGSIGNGAALGAAYRALHGVRIKDEEGLKGFREMVKGPSLKRVVKPDVKIRERYERLLDEYIALERQLIQEART